MQNKQTNAWEAHRPAPSSSSEGDHNAKKNDETGGQRAL